MPHGQAQPRCDTSVGASTLFAAPRELPLEAGVVGATWQRLGQSLCRRSQNTQIAVLSFLAKRIGQLREARFQSIPVKFAKLRRKGKP
ncbi:MAG: hypothetical protein C5B54_02610 [Acidobacteria bacterium]|nr:MAG: hypothetical protein C5B54_02610 [Acidobacteriota bacterium]